MNLIASILSTNPTHLCLSIRSLLGRQNQGTGCACKETGKLFYFKKINIKNSTLFYFGPKLPELLANEKLTGHKLNEQRGWRGLQRAIPALGIQIFYMREILFILERP